MLWVVYRNADGTQAWALADMQRGSSAAGWTPDTIYDSPFKGVEFFKAPPTFDQAAQFLRRLGLYVGAPPSRISARLVSAVAAAEWLALYGRTPSEATE